MASTESPDSNEYQCLVRVTDGKKNRFSTRVCVMIISSSGSYYSILIQVGSGELLKFQAHYGSLLKASMTTLRKRDKKQERLRSEEAAKRKKKMTEPVILDGPKRGKGRRTHQRKVKALLKQEESQKKYREREEARKKSEATVVKIEATVV